MTKLRNGYPMQYMDYRKQDAPQKTELYDEKVVVEKGFVRVFKAGNKVTICYRSGVATTTCRSIDEAIAVLEERGYSAEPLEGKVRIGRHGIQCDAVRRKKTKPIMGRQIPWG